MQRRLCGAGHWSGQPGMCCEQGTVCNACGMHATAAHCSLHICVDSLQGNKQACAPPCQLLHFKQLTQAATCCPRPRSLPPCLKFVDKVYGEARQQCAAVARGGAQALGHRPLNPRTAGRRPCPCIQPCCRWRGKGERGGLTRTFQRKAADPHFLLRQFV